MSASGYVMMGDLERSSSPLLRRSVRRRRALSGATDGGVLESIFGHPGSTGNTFVGAAGSIIGGAGSVIGAGLPVLLTALQNKNAAPQQAALQLQLQQQQQAAQKAKMQKYLLALGALGLGVVALAIVTR